MVNNQYTEFLHSAFFLKTSCVVNKQHVCPFRPSKGADGSFSKMVGDPRLLVCKGMPKHTP